MARARNIKPAIMDNEALADMEPLTRLLFIYLWMLADREGRMEDRPKRIAAQALPYDRAANVEDMLDELTAAGFIARYQVGADKFIQIVNFVKHQNPHGTERNSEIPDENGVFTVYERTKNGYATQPHKVVNSSLTVKEQNDNSLIPDSLIPDSEESKDSSAPDGADGGDAKPEKAAKAKPAKPQFTPPAWVPAEPWAEFVGMRRAMRNVPFTDAAARGVVAELEKLQRQGYPPEELLQSAVTNGWRTVYPPKGNTRAPPAAKHAAAARAIYGAPSNPEFIDVETVVRQH